VQLQVPGIAARDGSRGQVVALAANDRRLLQLALWRLELLLRFGTAEQCLGPMIEAAQVWSAGQAPAPPPLQKRAVESVPRNTPLNTTLIGSCSLAGMGPSMLLSGGMDTAALEAYLEQVLGPSLHAGQIVLLDNLSVHTSARASQIVAQQGCRVWY
jgi:DDE superfamily endonuclease